MRLGFSIASVRPRPGSRSSASAPVPKWTSRSSKADERPALSPIIQARDDEMVEAPTPPRTPITTAVTLGFSVLVFGDARTGNGQLRIGKGIAQLVGRERLQQIVLDAAGDEIAIEAHVVHLAGGDHHRARLADLGERVDVAQRVAGLAEVDEQDARARARRRASATALAKAALVDLLGRPAMLDGDRAKNIRRCVVADEGR